MDEKSLADRVLAVLYEEVAYIRQIIEPRHDIICALKALKQSGAIYQLSFTRQELIQSIITNAALSEGK